MKHRGQASPKRQRLDRSRICPEFGRCGGCSSFEPDYASEWQSKLAAAHRVLEDASGRSLPIPEVLHEIPRLGPRFFRRRLLYPIACDRRGQLIGGLYARGTHDIVPIDRCETQTRELTRFSKVLLRLLRDRDIRPFDPSSGEGLCRAIDLRHFPSTGDALATIVTRGGLWDEGKDFADELMERAQDLEKGGRTPFRLVGVLRNLNDDLGNRVLGQRFLPLAGRDYVEEQSGSLRYRVSAGAFHQSNVRADRLLFDPVLALLERKGWLETEDLVIDAYSGVGAFALRLAEHGAKQILCLEENPIATRDATQNAARNQLGERIEVQSTRVAEGLAKVERSPSLVLLDPARSGVEDPAMEALLALAPRRICYVSCLPKSLGRDLVRLESAYELQELKCADLFPRTEHVETVAMLTRKR